MNGMDMMLKAFGVNPQEVIAQIGQFGEMVKEIRDALVEIKEEQKELSARMGRLEAEIRQIPVRADPCL